MNSNISKIPFNRPYMTGSELTLIKSAHDLGMLAGDGKYTKLCHEWLRARTGSHRALLTHSCTAALEMAALLLDVKEGDEVIMPSFTFVSTANAFVLRGAVPVFVDIRPDTLNLDESLIFEAVTPKTKAIVPVHYAGVSCEMDLIMEIASTCNLLVIEDAAQAIMSTYKGKPLGGIGDLAAFSFHETKNLISGEGGSLLVNRLNFVERSEIIREKGTDRSQFFRGAVDKYSWRDLGSSYLPGEITAAFLWAQLQEAELITAKRMDIWENYHQLLEGLELSGQLRRPIIPIDCMHNAHMYYVIINEKYNRELVLRHLNLAGIGAVFHYVPLHSSLAGIKFCRFSGDMSVTNNLSERIIRLPLWVGMTLGDQMRVSEALRDALASL